MEKDDVKSVKIKDETLMQYLLGELPQAERDRLEDVVFADHDLFEQLEAVEDELIESYVRGELKQNDRQRFEKAYLSSPTRRQKVDHAKNLLTNLPVEPSLLSFVGQTLLSRLRSVWEIFFASRPVRVAFATIFVTVMSYSVWLNHNQNLLSEQMAKLDTERGVLTKEKQKLEQAVNQQQQQLERLNEQLQSEQNRSTQLEQELSGRKTASPGLPAVELQLGTRDATRRLTRGDLPAKIISRSAQLVQVQLTPKDLAPSQSFAAVLTNADDDTLWSQYRLEARTIAERQTLVLLIPAEVFSDDDDYILKLLVSSDGEKFDESASYTFRVIKR